MHDALVKMLHAWEIAVQTEELDHPLLNLQHPSLQEEHRVVGYPRPVTVLNALTLKDGLKLLRAALVRETLSTLMHLAEKHGSLAKRHRREWRAVADAAAQEAWGRPFGFADNRVPGIGNDAFTVEQKEMLRVHAANANLHERLALMFHMATGLSFSQALQAFDRDEA